jgi:hypothetical protein
MRYGQVFLDSLPQYSRTRDLEEVERFMSASDQDADPEECSDEG